MAGARYERKISPEEAREGYIMVLKDRLGLFPPVGERFAIHHGGRPHDVCVESRACICRGQERPHEHYFIRWQGLVRGARISIERTPAGYELTPGR